MPTEPIFPHDAFDDQKPGPDALTYAQVRVEGLHALSPREQHEWHDRLRRQANECGCELAARVAAFVTGAYLLALLTGLLDVGRTAVSVAVGAGVFVLASAGGKAFALARARRRLLADISRLRAEIAARRSRAEG